jgi:16S rRNA (guanine966-N2)-methyltransferase
MEVNAPDCSALVHDWKLRVFGSFSGFRVPNPVFPFFACIRVQSWLKNPSRSRLVFISGHELFKNFAMRISGGGARGVTLLVPKVDVVRPATDGLRQAVFSCLAAHVAGVRFADLFAGTGAYGLEALSRGAAGGEWVEQNARAVACLRKNLTAVCKSLRRDERDLAVHTMDALSWQPGGMTGGLPDLVFIDPPYELSEEVAPKLFARLTTALAAKPGALIIFELPGEITLNPPDWVCLKRLGKGARAPTAAIFRRGAQTPPCAGGGK